MVVPSKKNKGFDWTWEQNAKEEDIIADFEAIERYCGSYLSNKGKVYINVPDGVDFLRDERCRQLIEYLGDKGIGNFTSEKEQFKGINSFYAYMNKYFLLYNISYFLNEDTPEVAVYAFLRVTGIEGVSNISFDGRNITGEYDGKTYLIVGGFKGVVKHKDDNYSEIIRIMLGLGMERVPFYLLDPEEDYKFISNLNLSRNESYSAEIRGDKYISVTDTNKIKLLKETSLEEYNKCIFMVPTVIGTKSTEEASQVENYIKNNLVDQGKHYSRRLLFFDEGQFIPDICFNFGRDLVTYISKREIRLFSTSRKYEDICVEELEYDGSKIVSFPKLLTIDSEFGNYVIQELNLTKTNGDKLVYKTEKANRIKINKI